MAKEESNPTNNSQPTNPTQTKKLSPSKKLSQGEKLSHTKTKTSTSAIMTDKAKRLNKQKAMEQVAITDGVVFEAQATSPESKKVFKVPLRAAITNKDKDLDITKTSIWILMTLNQCSIKEVEEFEKEYKNELTYGEKLSIKLLKDALRGNKAAQQTYWQVMSKVSDRPKILNQVNFTVTGEQQGSIMSQMLDQITQNITQTKPQTDQDAQEGEIVS